MKLKFKRLSETAKLPTRGSEEAAGWDLYSDEDRIIPINSKAVITTNLAYEIPKGYALIIKDRSSMAKNDLTTNAGVLDSDYRGCVGVMIRNNSIEYLRILKGERIAQFLVVAVPETEIEEVFELSATQRGEGGFGSTGK